jgi:hypothetical protein
MQGHLHDNAAAMLGKPLAERIKYLDEDKWCGYPIAQEALKRMQRLFDTSKRMRMPNMALLGGPGFGKTHILEKFMSLHPGSDHPDGRRSYAPVIGIEAPPAADSKALLQRFLRVLCVPYRKSASDESLQSALVREMTTCSTRLVIIDEFHDILTGSNKKQREMLSRIKDLSNASRVPIVIAGLPTIQMALHADDQLRDRFEPFALKAWKVDDPEYLRLLASFEELIPLPKPSNLSNPYKSAEIHKYAGGSIGRTARLVNYAAEATMEANEEFIAFARLTKAGERLINDAW